MKPIKKWIAAAAAVCMAVGFTACSKDGPAAGNLTGLFGAKDAPIYCLVRQDDYDASGVLHTQTCYSYDDAGRVVRMTLDFGETKEIWNEALYIYEYLRGPCDGTINGEKTYSYDDAGIQTAYRYESWQEDTDSSHVYEDYTCDYAYGKGGEIRACTWTSQKNTPALYYDFVYEDGLLVNVKGYREDGTLSQEESYTYDRQGRLEQEVFHVIEGDFSFTYEYDDQGRVSRVATKWDVYSFSYDNDGRLITEELSSEDGQLQYRKCYEYDSNGFLAEMEELRSDREAEVTRYTCDDHGNVIAADFADGSRSEYAYEKMEVTPEEKEWFERQSRMDRSEEMFHRNRFYYHLIPNPVW